MIDIYEYVHVIFLSVTICIPLKSLKVVSVMVHAYFIELCNNIVYVLVRVLLNLVNKVPMHCLFSL